MNKLPHLILISGGSLEKASVLAARDAVQEVRCLRIDEVLRNRFKLTFREATVNLDSYDDNFGEMTYHFELEHDND